MLCLVQLSVLFKHLPDGLAAKSEAVMDATAAHAVGLAVPVTSGALVVAWGAGAAWTPKASKEDTEKSVASLFLESPMMNM
jgi:hypothetical protein